ncbi:MAG: polyphosphate kinase 1 [Phycisphaerae bacterium]|jgi:polyphosphate kinase
MATVDLDSPELYINRELSWLEFNDRVLHRALAEDVPLLERLKFLAITASNLDEFFTIRVASLKQRAAAAVARKDPSGLTLAQQLLAIHARVSTMVARQYQALADLREKLDATGITLLSFDRTSDEQKHFLTSLFLSETLPSLTPLAVEELDPCPILPGLQLNLALLLSGSEGDADASRDSIIIVPVPKALPRFVRLPAEKGLHMIPLEEVLAAHVGMMFPGRRILAAAVFRLTRDGDVDVQEEDPEELMDAVERAVIERSRRSVVRLELAADADLRLRKYLVDWSGAKEEDVFEVAGPLDLAAMMDIANSRGWDELRYPAWPPQPPRDLLEVEDLWQAVQERDVLLFHPYESFDPVTRLVELAAEDPNVLAIKQTLYRTSGDSPIIRALERAASNGKQVTVLVELKARFDEAKNVNWARRLEDAGCYVIYGVAGFKTHAKALLVVRREAHRIGRYVHLSTGNYNDKTARIYSDVGLMSSDSDLASDVAAFFNLVTGSSQPTGWRRFVIAPTGLRQRLLALIEREIHTSTPTAGGLIIAKLNSLQDKEICRALYRASQAGVRIRLNVRGICCLRPGVKGVSENIEVVSIVDRFLEHARIFYFRNGGHEEVYLSSADWMTRNLDYRLEVLFPVIRKEPRDRLLAILNTCLADNVTAWRQGPDGFYKPLSPAGKGARGKAAAVRAQECFYLEAVEAARSRQPIQEFRPLAKPAE